MTGRPSRPTIGAVVRAAEDLKRKTVQELAREVEAIGLERVESELARRKRLTGDIDPVPPPSVQERTNASDPASDTSEPNNAPQGLSGGHGNGCE
jgi:hypothetical protein